MQKQNEHTRAGYTVQFSDFILVYGDRVHGQPRIVYHRRGKGEEPDDFIARLTVPEVLDTLNKHIA